MGPICLQETSSKSMPIFPESFPQLPLPLSSVHCLRLGDVSVVSALGLSPTHRSDVTTILHGLSGILSNFNPTVKTLLPEKGTLLQEAENLALSLNNNEWKLLFLFVPADEHCLCQATSAVDTAVSRVEEALDKLHEKLHRTLVHVVVWSGQMEDEIDSDEGAHEFQHEEDINGRSQKITRFERATHMALLQESLGNLLQRRGWWSVREDFTVVLQSSPTYIDSSSNSKNESHMTDSHLSDTLFELWTKLLQPMKARSELKGRGISCLSQDSPYLLTQGNFSSQGFKPRSHKSLHIPYFQPKPMLGTNLSCAYKSPSPIVPTSVHTLRPGDIKVVGALGDSITAGNGVGAAQINLLGVMTEYRGLSWSIGGDGTLSAVTTLPNILRQFNPSLIGVSTGVGKATSKKAFLNQAVAGAESKDLVSQARALIARMKGDSRINFQNDWKVITVIIGGNDLCTYCSNTTFYSATNFANRIRDALDILQQEVPRALVNLVEIFYVNEVRKLHQDPSLGCPTWLVKQICPCVVKPAEGSAELQALASANRAYQSSLRNLVNSGRYNTCSDFTVVLQPFLRNIVFPVLSNGKPDRSFFAADCFHFSQKSHTQLARALWNNMLEPVSSKATSLNFTAGVTAKCPSSSANSSMANLTTMSTNLTTPTTASPVTLPPNWGSDFSCTNTSPSDEVPTSVHRLRPGDIKVVASLGDSITAGFGAKAKHILQLTNEERGVSWSIGGDETLETVTTLPNILKKFNPNVFGFSEGRSKRPNGLNMAVSGAKASHIPGQVRDLTDILKNSTSVDFMQDWKLVTLFIGGNDLCSYCSDRDSLSPKNYIGHIREALDIIYNEVPRVLVNFVEILQIEDLRKVKSNTVGCTLQMFLCPCFLTPEENSYDLYEMKRVNRQMQAEMERLVYSGRYDNREDFAVVVQPFFQNSIVPMGEEKKPDLTYFSVDCFHFSERGHSEMAIALWNNMLEPVGSKKVYNNFTHDRSKIRCPTQAHPFIFTLLNSMDPQPTSVVLTTSKPDGSLTPNGVWGSVPSWGAAVLAVCSLLIGISVTALVIHFTERKKRLRNLKVESLKMKQSKL
ncbi:phospholipase B1, membrane-associated [Hoplias malabaricus]|uniref:phospholipase B1, membrane-associated n=1 Tax=Hoplias malabaricus TaxID=27720 RepID=UPI003462E49C